MLRFFVFLFVLCPFSVFAACVSVDAVTKCARLPEGIRMASMMLQDANILDDVSWSSLLYDHQSFPDINDTHQIPISGTAEVDFPDVNCMIVSPFHAEIRCYMGAVSPGPVSVAKNCAEWNCDMSAEIVATALADDVCPDGFYTVPYDVSCGDGMVDVAGAPQCDVDTSGDYCLIGEVPAIPCATGITTLRTGTGVSIPLWAERGTEPSLCVKYNDMVCYGNLEPGQAAGAINVMYNDIVYHVTE